MYKSKTALQNKEQKIILSYKEILFYDRLQHKSDYRKYAFVNIWDNHYNPYGKFLNFGNCVMLHYIFKLILKKVCLHRFLMFTSRSYVIMSTFWEQ